MRTVAGRHMIVGDVDESVDLTRVYSLNDTAAAMWDILCRAGSATCESLADAVCSEYDIDADTALCDVRVQVDEWLRLGLVSEI